MHAPRSFLVSSIIVLALLARCVTPAHAAWPHDPNVNLPLCTATGLQQAQAIIPDGAGGAFVAWNDSRGSSADIYVQRISATGVAQWTADGVALCTAAGGQYYPLLVSDGAGGVIVTWQDQRGASADVYVQRVSGAGEALWTADGVALCTATNAQTHPVITTDGAGGAILTWQDSRTGGVDTYAQRVSAAGAAQWTADGVPICTAAGSQVYPLIVPDDAGGAIITWADFRNTNYDVYAQRVSASGMVQWGIDGVAVCVTTGTQDYPVIVPDGAGGAIIAWEDYRGGLSWDVYAQRVTSAGAAQWTSNGVAICAVTTDQTYPVIASDGAGGAIIAWPDARSGSWDIYAQRISALGAALWTADGVALCAATLSQSSPAMVADGVGGAVVAWTDSRNAGGSDVYAQRVSSAGTMHWAANGVVLCNAPNSQVSVAIASDGVAGAIVAWTDMRIAQDLYAQRIERFGYLGGPEAEIASVRDVPNDQGGRVKVSWAASYLEPEPWSLVTEYRVWRSAPTSLVAEARAGRVPVTADADVAVASGALLASPLGAQTYYWEPVGTVPAAELATYGLVTATTGDSIGGSNPLTAFMVEARTTGTQHWFSVPVSGYSVDDLAPATPDLFAGQYVSGTATLHWQANGESDLAGYRLYRGATAGFVPGPGNQVTELTATSYVDDAGQPYYYKLCAVDAHGNVSGYTTALPGGTVDVPGALPAELSLALASANPGRGGATLRWALPGEGEVRLQVLDVAGRVVQQLVAGRQPAGAYVTAWDGRDGTGAAVGAGLYLARLEALGRVLSVRIALLR
jgi:hypothetical protein